MASMAFSNSSVVLVLLFRRGDVVGLRRATRMISNDESESVMGTAAALRLSDGVSDPSFGRVVEVSPRSA